ncbi:MAM and LDL-receptor class A domain-containing protein 1 [Drosophila teissieri]|uniref:MAM and LDL-receptor class A domain-containing protein 1 n=1 Tax=Drosophila teissieri TaxID=7243 RepID=UPI001CBA4744|nr:MAM and LDL-receptor class A domain-containing protein 1 [Drosophila teissieri]
MVPALKLFLICIVIQPIASCKVDIKLPNGQVTESASWYLGYNIKFECNRGFSLQGKLWHLGNGNIAKRYCAKAGCTDIEKPDNGVVYTATDGLVAEIDCDVGFVLSGNPVTYCNGTKWILKLGTCQMANHTGDYSCDFEREDQCGWIASKAIPQPWKRISAAADFRKDKCLQQDHTFQSDVEGHFIRLQSQVHASRTYHFISPIYPRSLTLGHSLWFQFQLFMSGTQVGDLTISAKPSSVAVEDMWNSLGNNCTKLTVSGDQGPDWRSQSIFIDEMESDFQVVFTFTDPSSLHGDIGIDDVKFIKTENLGSKYIS